MTTTDRLDSWSVRIAAWAAPGETALAAQTTRAYAAGGTTRRNLFASRGHAPGGMGGGTVSVLPAVLDALAYAVETIKSALASPELSNALSATGLLLGLRAQRSASSGHAVEGSDPALPRHADGEDGADPDARGDSQGPAGQVHSPDPDSTTDDIGAPAAPTTEVMRAALQMSGRLRARGIEPSEADELAARVTARLLAHDDPAEVAAFLDALVAEEPPQPAVTGAHPRRTGLHRLTSAASGLLSRVGRPGTTGPRPPSSGADGRSHG
ncbi:hypothetical protein GCM10011579_063090 [Streptomyces albiflavescens]|uniref:Uncharacterized protein n=1 Tax=Streptomyces albiflavescens TaxID=1623582 RepID=A0A917YB40_9ACTN|nr:hypothetical protein [Streptomyces albiflavescens]GGN79094.1 hypothetical protein GCM10011579_063090 [Streptomyces albiflavescens]